MSERRTGRTPRARAWQHLYKTALWLRLRADQLARERLCRRCKAAGRVTAANTVHHEERHEGDPVKFFGGKLESLCKDCHDRDAQQEEALGFSAAIGADGWPIDPRHPGRTGTLPPPPAHRSSNSGKAARVVSVARGKVA